MRGTCLSQSSWARVRCRCQRSSRSVGDTPRTWPRADRSASNWLRSASSSRPTLCQVTISGSATPLACITCRIAANRRSATVLGHKSRFEATTTTPWRAAAPKETIREASEARSCIVSDPRLSNTRNFTEVASAEATATAYRSPASSLENRSIVSLSPGPSTSKPTLEVRSMVSRVTDSPLPSPTAGASPWPSSITAAKKVDFPACEGPRSTTAEHIAATALADGGKRALPAKV
mmetsp:Transcript_33421/g.92502  ORF Transcript_33421/g.92502 Transcript_33421/m.92502 type:complete len:234 (+) Transcript_33421:1199-1900(+)